MVAVKLCNYMIWLSVGATVTCETIVQTFRLGPRLASKHDQLLKEGLALYLV